MQGILVPPMSTERSHLQFAENTSPIIKPSALLPSSTPLFKDPVTAPLSHIKEVAQENQSRTCTVTSDSVRSQMADAASKIRQPEASVQEVCRLSGRDQRYFSACWCSQRENEFLACDGAFFGFSRAVWLVLG